MGFAGDNKKEPDEMRKDALTILIVAVLLWGASPVIIKMGTKDGLHPLSFALCATIFSAIFFSIYIFAKKLNIKQTLKTEWKKLLLLGIIATGLAGILYYLGVSLSTAMNAAFINELRSMFTIIFAFLLIGERIKKHAYLITMGMLFGAFLLTTNGKIIIPQTGDIFLLIMAAALGFTNAFAKYIMRKARSDIVAYFRVLFGLAFLAIILLPFLGTQAFSAFALAPWYVVLMGLLTCALLISLYKSIELVGPSISALFLSAGAVISGGLAFLILGETLSIIQIVGAAIILAGAIALAKYD